VSKPLVNRRGFLRGAMAAPVPLIGTALAAGAYQPTQVGALRGSAKSVLIPTHELAGMLDERLDFPSNWDINVVHMRGYGAPVLTQEQLAEQLSKPVGAAPLREIAAGKKTVAITFGEMSRPTPTYEVVPWVLDQLTAAGIRDENILFIAAIANHRPMTQTEVATKLGMAVIRKYAWINHSCFYGCKEIGTTSRKTNVMVNQTFMDADLKITLSGIKVHFDAGYGGGAKMVLPGVSHIDTVEHNHNVVLRETKTSGPVKTFKNEMRLDIIEAARLAKVDFSVQLMYDHKLRPIQVRSGDIVESHNSIVRVAAKTYCTPAFKDADIVVANAYPKCSQASASQRWINLCTKDGGTGVLIVNHPWTVDPIHFLNNRTAARSGMSWYNQMANRASGGGRGGPGGPAPAQPVGGPGGPGAPGVRRREIGLIVYSQYMTRSFMNGFPASTQFASTWEEVVKMLQERHKGPSVRVAVYPYAGIQHEEIELDG
jgi:nickel-dependent lactate racemase